MRAGKVLYLNSDFAAALLYAPVDAAVVHRGQPEVTGVIVVAQAQVVARGGAGVVLLDDLQESRLPDSVKQASAAATGPNPS